MMYVFQLNHILRRNIFTAFFNHVWAQFRVQLQVQGTHAARSRPCPTSFDTYTCPTFVIQKSWNLCSCLSRPPGNTLYLLPLRGWPRPRDRLVCRLRLLCRLLGRLLGRLLDLLGRLLGQLPDPDTALSCRPPLDPAYAGSGLRWIRPTLDPAYA